MPLTLSSQESSNLAGEAGEGIALAMRILCRVGNVLGAERLIEISSAHIDGCLFHGQASLDFAERLADFAVTVSVPTTLNVASLDLLHPELVRSDRPAKKSARRLMDAYVALGCQPTWTCAPYQLVDRPAKGEQIAWGESNAVVFANSCLGARTERYGDFVDICAAVTGRVPAAGLHLEENRRGQVLFDVSSLPEPMLRSGTFFAALGFIVGRLAGPEIPVILGLGSDTSEDQLKALGASAASSGSVALFHAIGVTPEASTQAEAFHGGKPTRTVVVDPAMLVQAREALSKLRAGARIDAVSVGTPHFSFTEFAQLVELITRQGLVSRVDFYVSTNRHVLRQVEDSGWTDILENAGIRVVVDTCTYVTPIISSQARSVMTDSGKWAYYGPANLGVDVAFGSLEECVLSAAAGYVVRREAWWEP